MMTNMGLLDEDSARREIEKLMNLLGVLKDLRSRVPQNQVDEIVLPLQRKAVRDKIRETMDYLRRWNVNLRAFFDDNQNN